MEKVHSTLEFRKSRPSDNFGLVQLVKSCPMQGATQAFMDRHPDFFALPRLQGDEWQVYVSECGGEIVGNFSYAYRQEVWGNKVVKVLHGGDLRVDPKRRQSMALMTFIKFYRKLLRQDNYHHGSAEIMIGNESPLKAQELLKRAVDVVGAGKAINYQLAPIFPTRVSAKWNYRQAQENDLPRIASLLKESYSAHSGQPVFSETNLKKILSGHPSFSIDSIWVAEDRDTIQACCGLWDQHSIRKTVVTRFEPKTQWLLSSLRLLKPILSLPALPRVGHELRYCYLRLLGQSRSEGEPLRNLIRFLLNKSRKEKQHQFLMVSFHEDDPMRQAVSGIMGNKTLTHLYYYFPKTMSQQERDMGLRTIPYVDFSLV